MLAIVKEKKTTEKTTPPGYRYLFRNYGILKDFLDAPVEADFNQEEEPEIKDKFIIDTLKLRTAGLFLGKKNYGLIRDIILNLDSNHPFIIHKRGKLYFKYLYLQKNYREFIRQCSEHPYYLDKLELKLFLVNSYIKTGNNGKAFEMFRGLFGKNELKSFQTHLPRRNLITFLKKLDDNYWFKKLKFLSRTNRFSEFLRERKYIKNRQLVNLFYGEFFYKKKRYDLCRKYLRKVKSEELSGYKKRILLKIDLRGDNYENLFAELEELQHNRAPGIYLEVLFDAASILLVKGEAEMALKLFSRYIKTIQYVFLVSSNILNSQSFAVRNANYWKALWLSAWICYKKNDKAAAAVYFRQGIDSHLVSYRVANTYWLQRLGKTAPIPLDNYPFSYYYTKTRQAKPGELKSLKPFINLVNHKLSQRAGEIIDDLESLVQYNLMDEAFAFIKWALAKEKQLTAVDKNILKLIESILHLKRGNYAMAFIRFRDNFECYQCMRLPRFLSRISLPIKYTELIDHYSKKHNLDSRLILALIREESFFQPGAVSYANAHGLMQLLLQTARETASPHGIKLSRRDLYNPQVSIRFGTRYFKSLLDKYKGKLHLALAAYNAGDHRVDQWLKRFKNAADDEFIEMIPFTATRSYVKHILRNYYYYRLYYGER